MHHKLLVELPMYLETERLLLRPYRAGDGGAYLEMCLHNKEHLLPYEAGNPALEVQNLEDAEVLVRQFSVEWIARNAFFLGAWQRESGTFVAQIYIGVMSWDLPEFEIGYFVDHRWAKRGFVTEAVQAALALCFDHLQAARLSIHCNETNTASWHVAERCGFTREGHKRQTHPNILCADGSYSGDYHYGLLRSEYVQQRSETPRR